MKKLIFSLAILTGLASCQGPTTVAVEQKIVCQIDSVKMVYRYPGITPDRHWVAYTDCGYPIHFNYKPVVGDSVAITIVSYKNLNQN